MKDGSQQLKVSCRMEDEDPVLDEAVLYSGAAEGPKNGRAYWVSADDGTRLRIGHWEAERRERGTVFLFPGRSEYIEIYGRMARDLEYLGYSTFVIDWRGQGLSDRATEDRRAGHVDSFEDYQRDVRVMVSAAKKLRLPKPWFLLAHSMGACIGTRSMQQNVLDVEACIFTAPMFDIHLSVIERLVVGPLTWIFDALGKRHSYAPGCSGNNYAQTVEFDDNRLTNEKGMYQYWVEQANIHEDLLIGGPTMGWLRAALQETKILRSIPTPDVPCIAYCGDEDVIVDERAMRDCLENWSSGVLKHIEGAKHELLFERKSTRSRIINDLQVFFVPRKV